MSRAVIGGLITSTLLTLVVGPVAYTLSRRLRDRARHFFIQRRAQGRTRAECALSERRLDRAPRRRFQGAMLNGALVMVFAPDVAISVLASTALSEFDIGEIETRDAKPGPRQLPDSDALPRSCKLEIVGILASAGAKPLRCHRCQR